MAKQGRGKKQYKLGTGKVTPMQIAFIVDRYLSDNSYCATLASFRKEASNLLSKTYGKEVPKGLMGLADILDDYIRLKEQKLVTDRDKQRVDAAMKRMQDAIQLYHSETPESVSNFLASYPPAPTVPLLCASNPINDSQQDNMIYATSVINNSKPPLPPLKINDTRFSAPARTQSYAEKRKVPKSKDSSPKKLRTQIPNASNILEGIGSCSNSNGKSPVVSNSVANLTAKPAVKGLTVVKKLFKNQECNDEPSTSSPKTPPRSLASQMEKSLSPIENSAMKAVGTSCSLMSSETIIISPLKNKGYYAVERSYKLTCSPLKSCSVRLGKRESVKGRLDFDKVDAIQGIETPCTAVDTSTSSPSDAETPDGLDFDLPDFEIFDGDFLSGLLVDFDPPNPEFSACHSNANCVIIGRDGLDAGGECLSSDQALPDCSVLTAGGTSSEGIGLQGGCNGLTPDTEAARTDKITNCNIKCEKD